MASLPKPSPASKVLIGISGWTYAPWRGTFFPSKLKHREELAYASSQVRSIEINGTFYSLQRPSSFARWFDETPSGFVFSIKGSRYITHMKRLGDIEAPLANFLASGILRLNEKLGPILWQLPPNFAFDAQKLERFFNLLPRSTAAAASLGRRHDARVSEGAWLRIDTDRPLRHALEVRHRSFESAESIELLRKHGIALVVADTAGKWPYAEDITSDFIYARLHGDDTLYVSGYTPRALDRWANKISAWSKGLNAPNARLISTTKIPRRARDVYVYFDNDVKTRAPFDAMGLAFRLGQGPKPAPPPPIDSISEEPRTVWPGFTRSSDTAKKRGRAGIGMKRTKRPD